MLHKILLTAPLLFIITILYGQPRTEGQLFLDQRIAEIIKENTPLYKNIIIKGEPIWWGRDWIFEYYLSEPDTTVNSIELKHKPTKDKIIRMMNEFDEGDYKLFNEQISNQLSTEFIEEKIITGGKGKDVLTIQFSQPLLSQDGNFLIVQEKSKSDYCSSEITSVYKKINDTWIVELVINDRSVCQ